MTKSLNIKNTINSYKPSGKNTPYKSFKKDRLLIIGFGGTISSGYSPAKETIIPQKKSPAAKQIEYFNLFNINNIQFDRIDLSAKDSRELTAEDIHDLLNIIHQIPNRKVLITAGTYMLPKISEIVYQTCSNLDKVIGLTGSILPAGFLGSDADANIWATICLIDYSAKNKKDKSCQVQMVFHGRCYDTLAEIRQADLHPKKAQSLLFKYPLSTILVDYQ